MNLDTSIKRVLKNDDHIVDQWFKLVAKYTDFKYDPETIDNWPRLIYKLANFEITLWFSYNHYFQFSIEQYTKDSKTYLDYNQYNFNVTQTPLYKEDEYIFGISTQTLIDELNRLKKCIKLDIINQKKKQLEQDFEKTN